MKKKTIIILSISLIIAISLIFVFISYKPDNNISSNQNNSDNDNESENSNEDDNIDESITPVITVELDRYNKTITILTIEDGTDLFWYNVELVTGSATLPDGTIDEGDMIINCLEILDFNWIPTNEIFLHCEFVRGE